MKVTINFTTDNAAYENLMPEEILISVLGGLVTKLACRSIDSVKTILDPNGNRIGTVEIEA